MAKFDAYMGADMIFPGLGSVGKGLKKMFGGGSKPDDYAARTNAEIARRNYDQYTSTYRPLESYLFEQLGDWDNVTQRGQAEAMEDANQSGKMSQDIWERRMEGFGLQITPGQRKAAERRFDLEAAKSAVNSANMTGRRMEDLQYNIMGGSNPRAQVLGNR